VWIRLFLSVLSATLPIFFFLCFSSKLANESFEKVEREEKIKEYPED